MPRLDRPRTPPRCRRSAELQMASPDGTDADGMTASLRLWCQLAAGHPGPHVHIYDAPEITLTLLFQAKPRKESADD